MCIAAQEVRASVTYLLRRVSRAKPVASMLSTNPLEARSPVYRPPRVARSSFGRLSRIPARVESSSEVVSLFLFVTLRGLYVD